MRHKCKNAMDSHFRGNDAIDIAGVAATTIIPAPRFREDRLRENDIAGAIDDAVVATIAVIPAKAGIHATLTEHECGQRRTRRNASSRKVQKENCHE